MPGRKKRTNRVLILITVLLCLAFGTIFTQSSSAVEPKSNQDTLPDIIVADDADTAGNEHSSKRESQKISQERTEEDAVPQKQNSENEISGQWAFSKDQWYYYVDEKPVTGWKTIGSNTYYFNKKGVMKTGWIKVKNTRYYLDDDGIMQTGWISLDGKSYYLRDDGSLDTDASRTEKAKSSYAQIELQNSLNPLKPSEKTKSENRAVKKATKKKSPRNTPKQKKTENSNTVTMDKAPKGAQVALTFDDGPGIYTDRLLDALEKNNAKATFFMVGTNVSDFPDTVNRMEKLGCELGNHTYSHKDLTSLSSDEISDQVEDMNYGLNEFLGHGSSLVRPPYGSVNEAVQSNVNYPLILWSLYTLDWETLDTQATVKNVFENVQDGDIILMHDIYENSVAAAEILIPELIKQGYELVTVSELAHSKGVDLQAGQVYGSIN